MMVRMASVGTPGTSSRSEASSAITSGGSTSARVETNWPSLIITPPISTAKLRNWRAYLHQRAILVRSTRSGIQRFSTTCQTTMRANSQVEKKTMRQKRSVIRSERVPRRGLTAGSTLGASARTCTATCPTDIPAPLLELLSAIPPLPACVP